MMIEQNLIGLQNNSMSWYSKKSNILTYKQSEEYEKSQFIDSFEEDIIMSIESIEKFYNLNSNKKLINIIIDRKESVKLFNAKRSIFSTTYTAYDSFFESIKQQKRINFFKQKYTYEALVQKFPKPKSGTNQLLLKILQNKMQTCVITSHQTRKNIWLLASGAKFNMINNQNLYQNLLKYHDYPKYFQRSIIQDLHRTVNKSTSLQIEEDIAKLKNVLIAFSRRNPYIGYCQGLNFIVFFLLTMQFTEEQAFFLLSTILQSIIPMDYYTNMIGVVCDQQIFINILKVIKPHIVEKFDELGLDPSILSIEWFVCLFTSSLPFYLVKIVWDRLLVQGTRAFMKTGLILLSYFEDSIMRAVQFHEIIMILQKGSKNLQVSETAFNQQFQKYYIDKNGLNIARNLYQQYHIKEKLQQQVISKRGKLVHPECDLSWPICISKLQRLKRQRGQFDVWIYKTQNQPKLIPDYLTNKPRNFRPKIRITGAVVPENLSNDEIFQQSLQLGLIETQAISYATRLQKRKEKSKVKNLFKKSSDLIIGRMDHICQQQLIEMEKIKKFKKTQIKFLSMIQEAEQGLLTIETKRCQAYKRIAKVSKIFGEEVKFQTKEYNHEEKSHIQTLSIQKPKSLEQQERALLAQSKTINFYNQFIQKNKELSSIICGINNLKNKQSLENINGNEKENQHDSNCQNQKNQLSTICKKL